MKYISIDRARKIELNATVSDDGTSLRGNCFEEYQRKPVFLQVFEIQ